MCLGNLRLGKNWSQATAFFIFFSHKVHFYKFRNTNPWNDGSERTGTLEMMIRCLPVCLLACMLLHHHSRANEAWSHLFSAWMRITPTLLGVWSHADGYHYLRGSAAVRHADVYHNVKMSERACTRMPSGAKLWQNHNRYVQPRTHARSRHLKMSWISVATEWRVLSKLFSVMAD